MSPKAAYSLPTLTLADVSELCTVYKTKCHSHILRE